MFAAYTLIFPDGSLIFFTFAIAIAQCKQAFSAKGPFTLSDSNDVIVSGHRYERISYPFLSDVH